MRHERPIGASSKKWKCPDGPFVCLIGTRDQGRVTSDWQLSLIVISSKARNLFHRDQGLTLPHMCRALLRFPHLSFIPPVPYPPLRGTFP